MGDKVKGEMVFGDDSLQSHVFEMPVGFPSQHNSLVVR